MAKLSTYALVSALAFALAPVAGFAADLPEPPALEPAPPPAEFGSAWYLRGDIGYKHYRNSQMKYSGYTNGFQNFHGEKASDAAIFGGGVGYKISDWFRTDVTVDYETPAKFRGSLDTPPAACTGGGTGCGSTDTAHISALTFFWNGYVDIGNVAGFTPYVGGGVGVARLDITKYKAVGYPTCPTACGGSYKGDDKWNFAWNLQAGVGYHVSDNLILDANYRFVDLGDAQTKSILTGKTKVKDIQAHEFRVGFRYLLD